MIRRLLKTIRRQPKVVRDKMALVLAGVFTAIVSTVWFYHTPERLAGVTEVIDDDSSTPAFSQFFSNLGDQLASVKESISSASSTDSDIVEVEKAEEAEVEDNPPESFGFASTSSIYDDVPDLEPITTTSKPRVVRIITTSSTTSSTTKSP